MAAALEGTVTVIRRERLMTTATLCALAGGLAVPAPTAACGGLFCSQANPVEQAAERILFVDHGDGRMGALIEIQYQGPAERFAWVLPLPGVPEIRVGSNVVFDRMQRLTAPQYNLETELEGECARAFAQDGGVFGAPKGAAVVVQGSGESGPYTFTVLSVPEAAADPAQAAVQWLVDHGYDVSGIGADLIRPYLADGLNLVAVKLTKGHDSGSIRPLWVEYAGDKPTIPIRPTAVAARQDMGILVWLVGAHRGVPVNYLDLHLNETRIDWLNPRRNYDDLVSAAADEAGGQGFVTEFAGSTERFADLLGVEDDWRQLVEASGQAPVAVVIEAARLLAGFSGLREEIERWVTTTEGLDLQAFFACPACFEDDGRVVVDVPNLIAALDESVAKPAFEAAALATAGPYVTRLYTTMSPDEMTHDPIFDWNPDLPDVDNVHVATRTIECQGDLFASQAPWRVTLPSGVVVAAEGGWPELGDADLPANALIQQLGTSGEGRVMVDNREKILRFFSDPPGSDGPVEPWPGARLLAEGGSGSEDAAAPMAEDSVARAQGGESGSLGCQCHAAGRADVAGAAPWWLAVLWLRRRQRSRADV